MISPAQSKYEQTDGDVRLMLAVRDGSSNAFEEIVRRYEGRVLAFLQQRTGNRHQAEDLMQEVFLRVFRARFSYKPTARFATWLTVIVRNVVANASRDRARRLETFLADDDQTNPVGQLVHGSVDESPTVPLEKAELRKAIRLAVNQLCERQRQAVVLQRYEYMKYEQIAAIMRTSPKAVKSLLSRARPSSR